MNHKEALIVLGALVVIGGIAAGGTYLHYAHQVESFTRTPFGEGTRTATIPKGTDAIAAGRRRPGRRSSPTRNRGT